MGLAYIPKDGDNAWFGDITVYEARVIDSRKAYDARHGKSPGTVRKTKSTLLKEGLFDEERKRATQVAHQIES